MKLLPRKKECWLRGIQPICKILLRSNASRKNTIKTAIPLRMSQFQFSLAKNSYQIWWSTNQRTLIRNNNEQTEIFGKSVEVQLIRTLKIELMEKMQLRKTYVDFKECSRPVKFCSAAVQAGRLQTEFVFSSGCLRGNCKNKERNL